MLDRTPRVLWINDVPLVQERLKLRTLSLKPKTKKAKSQATLGTGVYEAILGAMSFRPTNARERNALNKEAPEEHCDEDSSGLVGAR